MSEHLAAAAEAIGLPEDLARRSAEARAAADGVSVDDVLAAWAGAASAPAAGASAPAPVASPEPSDDPIDEPEEATADVAGPADKPAAVGGSAAAPAPPLSVRGAEALDYDAVITVATAGIAERTAPVTPRWLSLMFLIVPLLGLGYLITFAAGPNCGVGGQLGVDRLTGAIENCDGTEFVAAGGAGGVDIRGIIVEGSALYAAAPGNCTSCHGAAGQGGTGPALNGGAVVSTFAACADHIEWVQLGTSGFLAAGTTTYGDANKPVGAGGQMSGFATQLTPVQLATVVMFERVQFGGQDPNEAAADCGFVDPALDDATTALDE